MAAELESSTLPMVSATTAPSPDPLPPPLPLPLNLTMSDNGQDTEDFFPVSAKEGGAFEVEIRI